MTGTMRATTNAIATDAIMMRYIFSPSHSIMS